MSDHFSGPAVIGDPSIDITDFYVFPSPERPGWLTFVMNVFPIATEGSLFSDGVDYLVRVRSGDREGGGLVVREAEATIRTRFSAPRDGQVGQDIDIRTSWSAGAASSTGETFECAELRAFAGLRADPFFMDVAATLATEQAGALAYTEVGVNAVADRDVLSIVVEVPTGAVTGALGGPPLLACVAEVVLVPGVQPVRLERVGRPEIKNYILAGAARDARYAGVELRDLYNREDAFALSTAYRPLYESRLDSQLAFFDGLDGHTAWPLLAGSQHPLRELFLTDCLVVDPALPFAEGSFLEVEHAALEGRNHRSVGGRWLDDDFFDALLTLFVTGGQQPLGDGVDGPTRPASHVFPYVREPVLARDLPDVTIPGA